MNATTDVVQRLTDAAAVAIANERPALEHKPEQVRGITLELELSRSGDIGETTCSVQRRYRVGRSKVTTPPA